LVVAIQSDDVETMMSNPDHQAPLISDGLALGALSDPLTVTDCEFIYYALIRFTRYQIDALS